MASVNKKLEYKKGENRYNKMTRKCIYCKCEVAPNCVVDFCEKCGIKVWGPKMFNAIKLSMEQSREKGDLFQGSVE